MTGGDSSAVDGGTTGDGEVSSTASSLDSTVISSSSSSSIDGATTGDGYYDFTMILQCVIKLFLILFSWTSVNSLLETHIPLLVVTLTNCM